MTITESIHTINCQHHDEHAVNKINNLEENPTNTTGRKLMTKIVLMTITHLWELRILLIMLAIGLMIIGMVSSL